MEAFSRELSSNLFGNPHSASASSQLSTRRIEDVRLAALNLFNADPAEYDLVFVQNATAAIKLVMDGLRTSDHGFWLGYHADSHTSIVGMRESATASHCFESDEHIENWLERLRRHPLPSRTLYPVDIPDDVSMSSSDSSQSKGRSSANSCSAMPGSFSASEYGDDEQPTAAPGLSFDGPQLLAYPAQSNMNGRRLPLDWTSRNRAAGSNRYSLLDAASLVSTSPLDLSQPDISPDFVAVSFYKMFGFPDLGALIVHRRTAGLMRSRSYFGGGTVDMATCIGEQWHASKSTSLHSSLEDGTLPFHNIIALGLAIQDFEQHFGSFTHVSAYTADLTRLLYSRLSTLKHYNSKPVAHLYSDSCVDSQSSQGPIVAFNLKTADGQWYSTAEVEKAANVRNIHIRSGGLCNPGGIAKALHLAPWELRENFSAGWKCGTEDDIVNGKPTGMLRASIGATTTPKDIEIFIAFIADMFVEHAAPSVSTRRPTDASEDLMIEQLIVYPIKSCGGLEIQQGQEWEVRAEGLAWDREWCLVHQGTGDVLSQKKCARMACLRPILDFKQGLLRVRYDGPPPEKPLLSSEVCVPLSRDPGLFDSVESRMHFGQIDVCGDKVEAQVYSSKAAAVWFSRALQVPCRLARFAPTALGKSMRHIKPHLGRHMSQADGHFPLLLSNESPILAITRASLDKLNADIAQRDARVQPMTASAFRPNIVLASSSSHTEDAYAEDRWRSLTLAGKTGPTSSIRLDVLGPCRRCQMVCIDQTTADKRDEPLTTLARTRKKNGMMWFGVHMSLATSSCSLCIGDSLRITKTFCF